MSKRIKATESAIEEALYTLRELRIVASKLRSVNQRRMMADVVATNYLANINRDARKSMHMTAMRMAIHPRRKEPANIINPIRVMLKRSATQCLKARYSIRHGVKWTRDSACNLYKIEETIVRAMVMIADPHAHLDGIITELDGFGIWASQTYADMVALREIP